MARTLSVSHGGRTKQFNGGTVDGSSSFGCSFAALFVDVEHELAKIESGFRLALVYSLCWTDEERPAPCAVTGCDNVQDISRCLSNLQQKELADGETLAIRLENEYNIGLSGGQLCVPSLPSLSGNDATVFESLCKANSCLPSRGRLTFAACQVTRTVTEHGSMSGGCYRRGRGYYGNGYRNGWDESEEFDEEEFEACGDEEEAFSFDQLINEDGERLESKSVPIDMEEVLCFQSGIGEFDWGDGDGGDVDGDHEDATRTTTYEGWLLVAWARSASLEMLAHCGHSSVIKHISTAPEGEKDELIGRLLNLWERKSVLGEKLSLQNSKDLAEQLALTSNSALTLLVSESSWLKCEIRSFWRWPALLC